MTRLFHLASRLLIGAVLPEQQKRKLINQHGVTMEKVDELIQLDPTPKGSWMPWLIKWDKQDNLPSDVTQMITKFERMKNAWKPDDPRRNFGKYTPDQLTEMLSGGELTRQERRELPKSELKQRLFDTGLPGAKLIINDGTWKVWRVTNQKYEMLLSGSDVPNGDEVWCKWCTKHDNYARDYLKNGPVWPIFKNNEPFAQAHIGGGSNPSQESMASVPIILLDRQDHKMELSHELLELFEVLKPLPDYKFFEKYVWMTISKIPEDPKLLAYVKQYIEDEDDNRLRVLYLKRYFWPEALMSLLEDDYEYGLKIVMKDAISEVKKEIMESEFAPEMILYVDCVDASMFPAFASQGASEKFFSLPYTGDTKIDFGTLDPKVGKRFIGWLLGQDRGIFSTSLQKFVPNEALAKGPLAAYWMKNLAPASKLLGGAPGKLLNEFLPEYAQMASEIGASLVPLLDLPPMLEMDEEVKRGPSWEEGTHDGGPENTGIISGVGADGRYKVDWYGGPKDWNAHYRPPSYVKDHPDKDTYLGVLPLNADYQPSGNEPVPLNPLIEPPEEREKRNAQPEKLAVGDKVVRGPDWWDGNYDLENGTHTPGVGKVTTTNDVENGQQLRVHWSNGNNETYYYKYPNRLDVVKRSVWTGEEDPSDDVPGQPPRAITLVEGTQLGMYPPGTRVATPQGDVGTVMSSEQAQAAAFACDQFSSTEFLVLWDDRSKEWFDTARTEDQEHNSVGFLVTLPTTFRELDEGDRVTSGPGWNPDDGEAGRNGTVTDIDVSDSLSVFVSWDDGNSGWYEYDVNYTNRQDDENVANQIMPLPTAPTETPAPAEEEEEPDNEDNEEDDGSLEDRDGYRIGARVVRGPDWQFGAQDHNQNGIEVTGTINRITDGLAYVGWDGSDRGDRDYRPGQVQLA